MQKKIKTSSEADLQQKQVKGSEKGGEERFRMLFEKAPLGYQSLDANGNIIEVNETWLEILGYTKEEVIGKWFGDFLLPEYVEIFGKRFSIFKKQGKIHSEFEMVKKNGNRAFIAFDGRIGYSSTGKFMQTHCVLKDITGEKLTEKKLKEISQNYRVLFEEMAEGAFYQLADGTITDANKAVLEIFGLEREQFLGKYDFNWTVIDENGKAISASQYPSMKAIATGKPVYDFIAGIYNPLKNDIAWVSIHAIPQYRQGENKAFRAFVTMHDITIRKRAEEALKDSTRKLNTTINNLKGVIYRCKNDRDWTMEFLSNGIFELSGYPPEDFIGNKVRSYNDIVHPEDKKELWTKVQVANVKNESYSHEYRIIAADGSIHWVWERGKAVCQKERIEAIEGFITDISDRKKAETELKESEEKYRSLFENAIEGIYQTTLDGQYLNMNPSFARMFGFNSPEEMMEYVSDIKHQLYVHPEDRDFIKQLLIEKGDIGNFEAELYKKNGETFWVSINARLVKDENGKALFIEGTNIDITERKKAEKLFKESQHSLSEAQRIGKIGNWEWISSENKVIWSDEMYRLFGKEPGALLTKEESLQPFHPDDRQLIVDAIRKAIEKNEMQQIEVRIVKPDGEIMYVYGNGEVILDTNEKVIKVFGIYQDITERKRTEEALKEREEIYSSIVNQANDSIALIDAETGAYIEFNEMAYRTLGYEREEFMKLTIFDIDAQLTHERIQENIGELKKGAGLTFETKHKTKQGEIRDVRVSSKIINIRGKEYFATIWNDITEKNQREALLREKDLIFQSLMDNSPVYIFFKDQDIKAIHLSKNYEQLLGMPLEEALGKDMNELFPSELAKSMIEDDKKIIEEGNLIQIDEELNGKYYTTIKFPIHREEASPILAGFTIDITDRKRVEEEIRLLNTELEQRVSERTKELEQKNSELERMNKLFIGRELRMVELKKIIRELEEKLNR